MLARKRIALKDLSPKDARSSYSSKDGTVDPPHRGANAVAHAGLKSSLLPDHPDGPLRPAPTAGAAFARCGRLLQHWRMGRRHPDPELGYEV